MKPTNIQNLPTTKSIAQSLFLSFLLFISATYASAQTQLAVGASIGTAPTFGYEGDDVSGTVASIFGDITLKNNIIGRAAFTTALAGDSRSAANGSLGYNIVVGDSKLEIPIMATLGYIGLTYETLGNTWRDASLQIGGTISPQYFVTDRLAINLTARYLKGLSVKNSGKIDLTDISIGVKFALFKGE